METKEIRKNKRTNAKLYPIYKMLSWDLLFFYSIEFLFYTITKEVTASEILIINGVFLICRILAQIPAVAITDLLGRKKSITLGNILLMVYLIILITGPGAISIIVANLFFALGYGIKQIAETNLLYDSVSTKGGEGLYSKLDGKGGSFYYILDGIASLTAGYLFITNNYLPMYICLGFVILSTIISLGFKDIYTVEKQDRKGIKQTIKEYGQDLKTTMPFILKSKRMKAYILFGTLFYGIIEIIDTYRGDLLTELSIPPEQFSIIIAVLTFIGGISLSMRKTIEKKFKNRTLTFLAMVYIGACIIIGIFASSFGKIAIPMILLFYAVQQVMTSTWYIVEYKYLKNFTRPEMRNKITFTYEFIGGMGASIFSILGGILLNFVEVSHAFIMVGLLSLALMIIVTDYMKKRFGLKPEEYAPQDIELKEEVKK